MDISQIGIIYLLVLLINLLLFFLNDEYRGIIIKLSHLHPNICAIVNILAPQIVIIFVFIIALTSARNKEMDCIEQIKTLPVDSIKKFIRVSTGLPPSMPIKLSEQQTTKNVIRYYDTKNIEHRLTYLKLANILNDVCGQTIRYTTYNKDNIFKFYNEEMKLLETDELKKIAIQIIDEHQLNYHRSSLIKIDAGEKINDTTMIFLRYELEREGYIVEIARCDTYYEIVTKATIENMITRIL